MVKNIIFDMGQVLIRWDPREFLANTGLSQPDKDLLMREVFRNVEWIMLDRGTITEEAATESICKRLPPHIHSHCADLVQSWWKIHIIPMEGMAELVRELKGKGYGIYLLSNANLRLRTYFPRIHGWDCFDGLFVSAEHQLLKPQHEIYEKFLDTFCLLPQECFFIDDSPANIEGASRVGIAGTVFHGSTERLRRELRLAGIDCE